MAPARRRNLAAERVRYGPGVTRRLDTCRICGVPLSGLFRFQGARTGTRNHRCNPTRRQPR